MGHLVPRREIFSASVELASTRVHLYTLASSPDLFLLRLFAGTRYSTQKTSNAKREIILGYAYTTSTCSGYIAPLVLLLLLLLFPTSANVGEISNQTD